MSAAPAALVRILGSVEMARAFTLTALTAVFGSFAITRMSSGITLVTIMLSLCAVGIAILVVRRAELSLLRLAPSSLLAFLLLALASVLWSSNRPDTLTGWLALVSYAILAIIVGHIRDTLQTVRAIGDCLRALLALSLGVEILSGILLDMPILFLNVDGNLAIGGPIQGLFGTRNMLGFIAVMALITFVIEWRTQSVRAAIAVPSIALAGFLALLSASPAVIVLAAAVGAASAILTLVRHTPAARRDLVQWALAVVVIAALIFAFIFRHPIIRWMGAGSDFSMRADLWNTLLDFVAVKQLQGWGWVGAWHPDAFPFNSLNFLLGETHGSALNAYFDVLLQLGIIGLLVFAVLGGTALVRSWLVASTRRSVVYAWTPLILVALAIDSVFESFTLVDVGWFMLALCALRAGQSRSWRENIDAAHTGAIPILPPHE